MRRYEPSVILSAAKDLLAGIERRKKILRCAQDDKSVRSSGLRLGSTRIFISHKPLAYDALGWYIAPFFAPVRAEITGLVETICRP